MFEVKYETLFPLHSANDVLLAIYYKLRNGFA